MEALCVFLLSLRWFDSEVSTHARQIRRKNRGLSACIENVRWSLGWLEEILLELGGVMGYT